MTHAPFDSWEAERAPEAFADRTAAAVLRDRALSRRPAKGRWVLLAAAACVLIGGAAWGWTARWRVPPHDVAASRVDPVEPLDPMPIAARREALGTPEVLPPPPRPTVQVPVHPKATPALPPSAAPSASAPKVPLPQCSCNAFACDCGPE
jgi:hypothetical protein